jgi:transcriptional regulator with XRE-family HTH domain
MSLAKRVRDIRYAKGWGLDELANRAEISKTALYQIENGKTGLPRAATLRRIAAALEVPIEKLLLGLEAAAEPAASQSEAPGRRRPQYPDDWARSEGAPLSLPNGTDVKAVSIAGVEKPRFAVDAERPIKNEGHDWVVFREGELMSKLHDVLHSPIGHAFARILEEIHGALHRSHSSSRSTDVIHDRDLPGSIP